MPVVRDLTEYSSDIMHRHFEDTLFALTGNDKKMQEMSQEVKLKWREMEEEVAARAFKNGIKYANDKHIINKEYVDADSVTYIKAPYTDQF